MATALAAVVGFIAFVASAWLVHTLSPRAHLLGINARIASWLAFSPQGYRNPTGKYLLDVQAHTPSGDPDTVEDGQLLVIHIPPGKPVG